MSSYLPPARERLRNLVATCVRHGDFTLRSGQKSDTFIDLEEVSSTSLFMILFLDVLREIVRGDVYDTFIGPSKGADPLVYVGREGIRNRRGTRAIVLEDVLTTGGSVLRCIEESGMTPVRIVSVVDRGCSVELPAPYTPILSIGEIST